MTKFHSNLLRDQIAEKERVLAIRAESIRAMVQQQNKDRIELQRLLDLLEKIHQASTNKDDCF